MDRERYYVLNGELKANTDYKIADVLMGDLSELELIQNMLEPGVQIFMN